MTIEDVISLLNSLSRVLPQLGAAQAGKELDKFKKALSPCSNMTVDQFCLLVKQYEAVSNERQHRRSSSTRADNAKSQSSRVDESKIMHVVDEINNAIDNMRSDSVSFDYLESLADKLVSREYSRAEVMRIAELSRASRNARSKKEAITEIRNMLRQLKATAMKTPM